jgi:hypothetical protein
MREKTVKMFMPCCNESSRVPYCKQGSDNALHAK